MTPHQRRQLRHLARQAVNTREYSGLIAFVELYDARPRPGQIVTIVDPVPRRFDWFWKMLER